MTNNAWTRNVPVQPRLDIAGLCAQVAPDNMPDPVEFGTMGEEQIDDDL